MSRERQRLGREAIEQLVVAARRSDPHAIGALCEHFYPELYRYVLRRVGNREDAEDLTSEVCVRAVKTVSSQTGFFPAWLFRIAANLVTDFYRRRGVRQEEPLTEEVATSVPGPRTQTENALVRDQLEQAVARLTPEQQDVIRLKFNEGYDTSETAEILGKSVGAVRAVQFRALKALRSDLSDEGRD
jgi:RNA polymerase sigma-70 factor (ECF subfamily)